MRKCFAQVAHACFARTRERIGEGRDHAQHCAIARLGHGRARLYGPESRRRDEMIRTQAADAGERLTRALQELGEDCARVATRPVDRLASRALEHIAGMRMPDRPHCFEHRAQSERKIAAGVAVGNRKYIDPIQRLAAREHAADAGNQARLSYLGRRGVVATDNGGSCNERATIVS